MNNSEGTQETLIKAKPHRGNGSKVCGGGGGEFEV